jgi:hypothetical protein
VRPRARVDYHGMRARRLVDDVLRLHVLLNHSLFRDDIILDVF